MVLRRVFLSEDPTINKMIAREEEKRKKVGMNPVSLLLRVFLPGSLADA